MITITKPVYKCEFCTKLLVQKGFMALHERMCKYNPNNKHKCFEYCTHLSKETSETYDEDGRPQFVFLCSVKNDLAMYSYKLERFAYNQGRIKNLTRMPLECDLYKPQDGHYYQEDADSYIDSESSFFDV